MHISLEMVLSYMAQNDWEVDNSYKDQRGLCILYSNDKLGGSVLLPAHDGLSDLQRMLMDAIRIISQREERSYIDVENDILGDSFRDCPFCGSEAKPGICCVNEACIAHNMSAKEHISAKAWNKRHVDYRLLYNENMSKHRGI